MPLFLSEAYLLQLGAMQIVAALLVFVWTGFVRSGLGFGGAALGLPLMLLIDDSPLFWLPMIGAHLLFFTAFTLLSRIRLVDWSYLGRSLRWILPAKLAGVFGLLNLPNNWLVLIIYSITLFYALLWLFALKIQSKGGWSDPVLLLIGGYVSGTSLTGAPMLVAVYMQHVALNTLRNTLFVLWFLLVTIKMGALVAFDVPLHLASALWLLPCAALGHYFGLKVHEFMLRHDAPAKRILGAALAVICILGLIFR
jgi:hypothetical protein